MCGIIVFMAPSTSGTVYFSSSQSSVIIRYVFLTMFPRLGERCVRKGHLTLMSTKSTREKWSGEKRTKRFVSGLIFFWIFLDYSYFRALMLSHQRHPTIYFPEINSSLRRAGSTRRLLHIPTIIMILGLRLGQKRLLVKPAVLFWWLIMNSSEMWEKDLSKRLCIQCFIM